MLPTSTQPQLPDRSSTLGGNGSALSLLELFALLEELLELPSPLRFEKLPRRQSDQDFFVADTRKAADLLKWSPSISAQQGIQAMLEWSRG